MSRPQLPLLVRELTQAAARRRTYAVRVAFGLALLLVFAGAYQDSTGSHALLRPGQDGLLLLLGQGRALLLRLGGAQLVGVLLIQPALMAGALAGEKQARTLELLLVTGISPAALLLQKWAARLRRC